MQDDTGAARPRVSDSASPDSSLSFRISTLEAAVAKLEKAKPSRIGSFGVFLGMFATLLALPSAFVSVKGLLFPSAHTTLSEPNLEMNYDPPSQGLTFTMGIAATNDGNQDDSFSKVEASLAAPSGRNASPDKLAVYYENNQPIKPPLIIPRGETTKIFVSPTFKYPESDPNVQPRFMVLQIAFQPNVKKGKGVKTQLCFSLGSNELKAGNLELSTDCPK